MSQETRVEAGFLLRQLRHAELLSMPQSRPMPSIGARCHELRVNDVSSTWRVIYRIDKDAIGFSRSLQRRPAKRLIGTCRKCLKEYEDAGK
jgi:hypothetical protein